ncbi:MAG: hypothetical protein V3V00_15730 [Saprospiraceae bacterium]
MGGIWGIIKMPNKSYCSINNITQEYDLCYNDTTWRLEYKNEKYKFIGEGYIVKVNDREEYTKKRMFFYKRIPEKRKRL